MLQHVRMFKEIVLVFSTLIICSNRKVQRVQGIKQEPIFSYHLKSTYLNQKRNGKDKEPAQPLVINNMFPLRDVTMCMIAILH